MVEEDEMNEDVHDVTEAGGEEAPNVATAPPPGEGQPPPFQPPPQTPPPMYQPPPPQQSYMPPPQYQGSPPQPAAVTLGKALSQVLPFLLLLGTILLLVGFVMLDVADHDDEGLLKGGHVMYDVGIFLIALPLLMAGLAADDQHHYIRMAMIFAAAIVIYGWIR